MESASLLDAIAQYCNDQTFSRTEKALRKDGKINPAPSLIQLFEGYFEKKSAPLSFTFQLSNDRSNLRKRLRDMESAPAVKKQKLSGPTKTLAKSKGKENAKEKVKEIPEQFLLLLDELRLDRKDARKFYENKSQWSYVMSDRKIYCVERGMLENRVAGCGFYILAPILTSRADFFIVVGQAVFSHHNL